MPTRYIIGCMTGTSIDGIDAAMVAVDGVGLEFAPKFVHGVSGGLGALAAPLRALADQKPMPASAIAGLAREFSLLHAEIVRELIAMEPACAPSFIAVHGQTVFHAPPVSWQVFNPAPLVEATGLPVVFDLRTADLARGGQGAPITPMADWLLLGHAQERRAIVNLGGFCNITILPDGHRRDPSVIRGIRGFDVCACNHLLNTVARAMLRCEFDRDGTAAGQGDVLEAPLEDLLGVLASQAGSRRSLGTGDESADWVSRYRAHARGQDLAATACEALGQTIARRIGVEGEPCHRVLLAGGGARNQALVRAIAGWASAKVATTDAHGLPIEFREAAAIAVLGGLCADGFPITLPSVTGVREPAPLSGVWAGIRPAL